MAEPGVLEVDLEDLLTIQGLDLSYEISTLHHGIHNTIKLWMYDRALI
jgi:hypothetical protein